MHMQLLGLQPLLGTVHWVVATLPFLLADAAPWIFGGLGLATLLTIGLVLLLLTIFWIWMFIDCISNDALDGTERLLWAVLIFFSHFLGSTIYFLLVRNKRGGAPSLPS